MSTRTDVLAEFTRGTVTRYFDTDAMADEIATLRERVRELEMASAAGVTVTEAMVERFSLAYRICEETHERTFTHNMGIKAGLTAALTAALTHPTTPTRGSDE